MQPPVQIINTAGHTDAQSDLVLCLQPPMMMFVCVVCSVYLQGGEEDVLGC